ncbi:protein Las1p [Trichomonascus vanleenenianus]|uniref:rRNA-processing protein LAS1 n=1 Tax=Trichomonascus vanleenenianus TaxID=2268995 RepID=UPI003EC9B208
MLRNPPKVVAWRGEQELFELKSWFYPDPEGGQDRRARAVARVKALQTRAPIPHAIESTGLLTAAILGDTPGSDSFAVRMAYSMALIRFVNGLLDPSQKAQFAIPLHALARSLGLPSFFVELRHSATHEGLPSLEVLRQSSHQALGWLWEHYWALNEYEEDTEAQCRARAKDQIKDLMRDWRRLRRSDPAKVVKLGDTSAEGAQYWKLVNAISTLQQQDEELLFEVLYTMNVLVPTGKDASRKVNSAIKLFAPLLDTLNSEGMVQRLALFGIDLLNSRKFNDYAPESLSVEESVETISADAGASIVAWINHFMTPREKSTLTAWLSSPQEIIEACFAKSRPWNVDILKYYISTPAGKKDKATSELTEAMESQIRPQQDTAKSKKRPIGEIEEEVASFTKRIHTAIHGDKQESSSTSGTSGWRRVSNWTARPIGKL